MPIRANNFYNLQESRSYPLDDTATGVTDTGAFLPNNILTDLNLRFPQAAGEFAFVAGVTVTPTLVTVIIMAAASHSSPGPYVPLAAISLPQPVVEARQYALSPLYPGTGGWITLGSGTTQDFTGRFSTPGQGLIAPRCSRVSQQLPVSSLGKLGNATALTGLITVKAGTDIGLSIDTLEISGVLRSCLVIELVQTAANGPNVLATYVGPCGVRPESQNCGRPGIQYVNDVAPDCNGNLKITFVGALLGPYSSCGAGTTIDLGIGINQVCAPTNPIPPPFLDSCDSSISSSLGG